MSNNVSNESELSAYNELITANLTPVAQISAEYGLLIGALTTVDASASGTVSAVNHKFVCETGTSADGLASILAFREVKYRPGEGMLARLSAIFDTPKTGNIQGAGLISAENSLIFGYVNETFGISRIHSGVSEYQEMVITTPAGGAETADITIDGVLYNVPITSGTVQHNAWEIAEYLKDLVLNFGITSNDDTVGVQSVLARPLGAFTVTSSTLVASWTQVSVGVQTQIDFIPQSLWNVDVAAWLDPSKGNVYQIRFKYLGFGGIRFYLEDPETANFILVHVIKYANTTTDLSISNPVFRVGWATLNQTNTTNVTLQGGSASAFIEGSIETGLNPLATSHEQLAVGTTLTNIITIRNRTNINTVNNRAQIKMDFISMATQANKPTFFVVVANPEFSADMDFQYLDESTSLAEIATQSVEIIGGKIIKGATVTAAQALNIAIEGVGIVAGELISIAAQVSSGAAGDMQVTMGWKEDL